MPRKAKSKVSEAPINPNDLINLGENLEAVVEEIASAPILTDEQEVPTPVKKDKAPTAPDSEETDRKRAELLVLSSDGVISKSVAQINKASAKAIDKIYAEYDAKRLEKASEFLCDQFISKFSALLGGLDAIEKPEEMERELKSDPLLRKDLKVAMAWLRPLIPFLGLLSGGVTIGKHVWEKQVTDVGDSFANGPFEKNDLEPSSRSKDGEDG